MAIFESQTRNQYSTSTTTSIKKDARELPCYLSMSVWKNERKGGHTVNYSRFLRGLRRGRVVGDGEGVRWLTCQESRNSHECAAKHTVELQTSSHCLTHLCFCPSLGTGWCLLGYCQYLQY